MSFEVGFQFYKKKGVYEEDGKKYVTLEPVSAEDIIKGDAVYNVYKNSIYVCGRSDASYRLYDFVNLFKNKCGENEYPAVVFNQELNECIKTDTEIDYSQYTNRCKLFYKTVEELEEYFDFDSFEQSHKEAINSCLDAIKEDESKIKQLREYQCKAETAAAFGGFQKEIDKIEESISDEKIYLKECQEDDYGYIQAKHIYEDIKEVKRILSENPDIVVIAN